jgi:hypothetical protein
MSLSKSRLKPLLHLKITPAVFFSNQRLSRLRVDQIQHKDQRQIARRQAGRNDTQIARLLKLRRFWATFVWHIRKLFLSLGLNAAGQ